MRQSHIYFANLSDVFMVLCDFLGRARALKAIHSWNTSPKHAFAMNRFGNLTSLVWAKLILGRIRDAVLPDFSRFSAGSDDYFNAFFSLSPFTDRWLPRKCTGSSKVGFVTSRLREKIQKANDTSK